jgi:AcrR family transcriptional regulator
VTAKADWGGQHGGAVGNLGGRSDRSDDAFTGRVSEAAGHVVREEAGEGRAVNRDTERAQRGDLEAVSMQRIAADLGFTKMSLYRHVSSKSELLNIMIETVVGEPPDLSGVPGGWRARLEEFVRQLTEVWRQHPWLPAATVGVRAMGPRETGWTESAVAALAGTGLAGDERLAATFVVFGHIRNTQQWPRPGPKPGRAAASWPS